ncbi:MAG: ribosome maturation factor RimM [Deltaproteobacteria bacterium]|nr:ribosome maturation factor RimM [Deltaproteobacteria bacterium]
MEVGKITKTRGLKGTLKVASFLTGNAVLSSLGELFILSLSVKNHNRVNGLVIVEPSVTRLFTIKKASPHSGSTFYLDLMNVDTVEEAMPLVGCHLLIPPEWLPPLPTGEYYWHEIVGLRALSPSGDYMGIITDIFSTKSNDVYICRNEGQETLLPATEDCIVSVDIALGVMVANYCEVAEDAP